MATEALSDPVQLTLVVIIISVLQFFLGMVTPPAKLGCVSTSNIPMWLRWSPVAADDLLIWRES